ncbi:MAG: helix-hairpin-helix domain-containing protein [Ignavibacteria bacterium]|nr:helix-hairpin-helix domain-containing protein [Ignavibacteria bacterium]
MKDFPLLLNIFLLILFLLIFGQSTSYSQTDTTDVIGDTTDLNDNAQEEILLENVLEDIEDSKLLDYLENLKKNPYDLNKVTQDELETIPFLNAVFAKRIIDYRKKSKYFNSKRELLKINGITDDLYDNIKVFLVVRRSKTDYVKDESGKIKPVNKKGKPSLIKDLNIRYRSRFLQDLQPRKGYLNGNYAGSRAKIYNQLNFRLSKINYQLEGNFTIEKDPGETSLTDFKSGFLMIKNFNFIKKGVVGDYTLDFGQGIGTWSSFGFSKGNVAVNSIKRKGKGINRYSSVDESQFFRGAATQVDFKNFDISLFYSDNYLDATIDTTFDEASGFYTTGFHRTITELVKENSIKEKLFGGRIGYTKDFLKLGVTYWNSRFSKPFIPDEDKELYNFTGDKANMLSFDYDYIFENMNLYGEVARSQNGAVATLNSLQITFFKISDLVFSYRNYSKDFIPLHSNAFGERSGNTQNETGFYSGITLRPLKGLIINAYYDQFKFPYRSYFDPVSIQGNDLLTYVEWKLSRDLNFYLRYKNENKGDTRTVLDEFGREVKKIDNRSQLNVRTGLIYEISKTIRVRSRFEYVYVSYDLFGGNNKGLLFYSDLRFIPLTGLTIDTRIIFFDTDSYDSRIYEFENEIRGVLTNLAMFDKGTRWYLLLRYKPFPFIEISGKYAETYIDGAKSIGSGNDEIEGDINNRLNIGLEILF